jgi:HEAT repeat protein
MIDLSYLLKPKVFGVFCFVVCCALAVGIFRTRPNGGFFTERLKTNHEATLLVRFHDPDPVVKRQALEDLASRVRTKELRDLSPYLPWIRASLRNQANIERLAPPLFIILRHGPTNQTSTCLPDVISRLEKQGDAVWIRRASVSALRSLGSSSDQHVVGCLVNLLKSDQSPSVRREAALALTRLSGKTTEVIKAALEVGSKDPDNRVSIASALGIWRFSKNPAMVEIFLTNLNDTADAVRTAAAGSLYQIANAGGEADIEPALKMRMESELKKRLGHEQNLQVKFWVEEALRAVSSETRKGAKQENRQEKQEKEQEKEQEKGSG